jgi:N utilization substance protein A
VDELAGERIDIVRWNDSLQILVPNALQPADVEDVILCPMLGKVIVLVREDQLSLAIGKFGQNVRLASKLVGWDINVMTQALLDAQLDKSIEAFCVIPEVQPELAENLVSQGFFTFDDLSVIEPDQLAEMSGLSDEDCDRIITYADAESARIEQEERIAAEERKRQAAMGIPTADASALAVATPRETAPDADSVVAGSDSEAVADGESSGDVADVDAPVADPTGADDTGIEEPAVVSGTAARDAAVSEDSGIA